MPKRIVHGEGLWRSNKLGKLSAWARPEYANLIPLALANGSFDCDPRRVWCDVYSFNRPEITLERVQELLDELVKAKLLFRWTDDGRQWGYWIGIEKAGRLPPRSRQEKKHELIGAIPPADELKTFLKADTQPMANQTVAIGEVGSGSGFGFGIGKASEVSSEAKPASDPYHENTHPKKHPKLSTERGLCVATTLRDCILENDPKARVPKDLTKWAHEAELLISKDGRTEIEVIEVLKWAQSDRFWKANILSIGALRDKFTQLNIQRNENSGRASKPNGIADPGPTVMERVAQKRTGATQ